MIPYVEFNYEWKEAMGDSEPISVRIKREAASFKYLSFGNGQTYLKFGYQHAMCIQKDIFG